MSLAQLQAAPKHSLNLPPLPTQMLPAKAKQSMSKGLAKISAKRLPKHNIVPCNYGENHLTADQAMTLGKEALPSKANGCKRRVDSAGEGCIIEIHVLLPSYY